MRITIDPEYSKLIPSLDSREYSALRESIREEGLHYPIIVNANGTVLDGHNRFRICSELGIELTEKDLIVKEFDDPLLEKRFVIISNLRRRQLTDFQRAELGVPLREIEETLAKRRQRDHGDTAPGRPKNTSVQMNTSEEGRARDIVAKQVGLSPTTFHRALTVLQKATEEVKEEVRSGELSISAAYEKTQLYLNLRAPNLRTLVGDDRAEQLAKIGNEGLRNRAVNEVLEHKIWGSELEVLITRLNSGSELDTTVNEIETRRKDERARRYRETKNEGITRTSPCVVCRRVMKMQHLPNGTHILTEASE